MREEEIERIVASIIKQRVQSHFESQATLSADG